MQLKNRNFHPFVSVIVPAYNEEKYIEECLFSLRNQTYSPIEVIFVDDGSNDNTRKKAKHYADIIYSQKHKGPAVARNAGANLAKGKILVFIDADMYVDRNYVESITKPIREKVANATFTKDEYVANMSNIWARCLQIDNNLPQNNRIQNTQEDKDTRFRAIRKEKFLSTGGYLKTTGYGEDSILPFPESVRAENAICYHYNPDTLSDVFLSARWMGRSKNMKKNLNNLFRYSILNSVIVSSKKIYQGAPVAFLLYKIVFDFGIFIGILMKNPEQNFAK